ncbi:hypothetical protein EUAN_13520 [Andreesenia angusta]|uniref:Uncharacterized protein n=1 Tax=Andreesenia angusta TaxID=39480 RepID=A0A1S1V6X0_9FIRM|nr:hypothetical protein [Andreesenia angusta]OHW62282.1 hypothetical protein EUAN_13520 [Andreesenia angusta]
MELNLSINSFADISSSERLEIDGFIMELVETHKRNRSEISKLAFDSVSALTASTSRLNEALEQGF